MSRKKSQIHMLETIAVLAVFFILVVLGFVFYTKMVKTSVEEEKEENIELSAVKTAQRAGSLPELQCSENNVVKDNCVDRLKLEAAITLMKNPDNAIFYYDKLFFSRITIQEIYPTVEDCANEKCTLYDRPLDDYTHKIVINIPISIFNPEDYKNAFGVMTVETYLK